VPDTWVVTPTSVTKNGAAITGYTAHALSIRHNTEGSSPFSEQVLVVRIIDPASEAAREAPLTPLSTANQAIVLAEYAYRPAFTEWRSKPGDTITFSGSVTAGSGSQGMQPGGALAGSSLL